MCVRKGAKLRIQRQRLFLFASRISVQRVQVGQVARAALEGRNGMQIGAGQVILFIFDGLERSCVQGVLCRVLVFAQLREQLGGVVVITAAQVQLRGAVILADVRLGTGGQGQGHAKQQGHQGQFLHVDTSQHWLLRVSCAFFQRLIWRTLSFCQEYRGYACCR